MQSLLESQRHFVAALGDPAIAATMPRGFAVYVGNVRGNWTKALAAAYPIVRKIVGEGFFENLAWDFARAHASLSGDLNEFGERLPDFLATCSTTRDLPYLPDVATMEWLAHRAYYAANAVPPDPARLAAIDPARYSRLRLARAPASALYGSQWVKTADDKWTELLEARFSHDETGKSARLDRFMGVENGKFFLSQGGFVAGSTKYGEAFTRPATGKAPVIVLPVAAK